MPRIKEVFILLISLMFFNCGNEDPKYPLDKRYWTELDYANVIRDIKLDYLNDEILPSFNDPNTKLILDKLTDKNNYLVVLDDDELGIKHKNNIGEKFFMRWKSMNSIYYLRDRKDDFIYEEEYLKIYQFGLGVQLRYFKLGNEEILSRVDDPNSTHTKTVITSNINTLIKNYNNYLEIVNDEKSFSNEGKLLFSNGIDEYFTELYSIYPNGNYDNMIRKIDLMEKKSDSEVIKKSLINLKDLINKPKDSIIETTN